MNLVQKIMDCGVVGAGGAGFPAHVKINAKCEYVILNGAECEPLLRVDQQLMELYAEKIIKGLEQIVDITEAKKAFIGIKGKHKKVVEILKQNLVNNNKVEVFVMGDFYPAGDEQALVHEVTKRVVPEGGIPLKVNCIVTNVETVINIYDSIEGKPVTHTYLTVGGDVPNPVTLYLPVGITVKEALGLAGVKNFNGISIIDGGPMMGKLLGDINSPITKASKGYVVLKDDHSLIIKKKTTIHQALRQSKAACLQCRLCTELCPRYLLGHNIQPHLMMRKSNYDYETTDGAQTAFLCCECSACELYACPASLSPKLININFKQRLAEKGIKYTPTKTEFEARSFISYRKIPSKRLISRLGLKEFDVDAPLDLTEYKPEIVNIPLKQHIGAPSVAIVKVGDVVRCGDLIAQIPENALGANVHASINGTVTAISSVITIEGK